MNRRPPVSTRTYTHFPSTTLFRTPASSATSRTKNFQLADTHTRQSEIAMNFLDGSLFPENQDKLIITAAPYGPEWIPSDFPEDIPVTMEQQIQKAVDCYNAGASVLHLHVRELDGQGSKRLSKFNELARKSTRMNSSHSCASRLR